MELLQSIVSGASLGSLNCNSGFVSIFNNAAAFVELLTDKIDLFWRSVFIRVIRGRIQGDGDSLSLRF
jgi:hypothetical protein